MLFLDYGKKPSFSHTWCHDISWSVPLDFRCFNPFIDISLGSIPLNIFHVDYTFIPLAFAGSSHKKEPDALGTCRTILISLINYDHNQSGAVGGLFSPQERPLEAEINLKHCCIFCIGKKWFWIAEIEQIWTKLSEKTNKNIKIQSKIAFFSHFGCQLWDPHPKKHKNQYFGRIKPYKNPYSSRTKPIFWYTVIFKNLVFENPYFNHIRPIIDPY